MSGAPAMHAGLMENGRVFFLDKVENYTQLKLPDGQYAYSAEYDPATNQVVPLQYKTNAFCSGGSFLPDGRVISVGGNAPLTFIDPTVGDGFRGIRYLQRSANDTSLNGQSWSEPGNQLNSARWYASVASLADGTQFVASGSLNGLDPTVASNNNPTYELLSATGESTTASIPLPILAKNQPYYMYPILHLLPDGSLFIFVSKSAELFSVADNTTLKTLPDLPGDYRTYPNAGGSVLLPLSSADNYAPAIQICGGGGYQDITSPTDPSCGLIRPLSPPPSSSSSSVTEDPEWEMDSMPTGRGMGEAILLPDGTVLWVNGCSQGAQGFGLATDPTYTLLLYNPSQPLGQRWRTAATSSIARLYHSVALLLLDGTVLIAGSNPVQMPLLTPVPGQVPSEDYVTEFRVEVYTPPYLAGEDSDSVRPKNVVIEDKVLRPNESFAVAFDCPPVLGACSAEGDVKVLLHTNGFVTHSLHMNQRMVYLDFDGFKEGAAAQSLRVAVPPSYNILPPQPYVLFVVVGGVPSFGQFVRVQ